MGVVWRSPEIAITAIAVMTLSASRRGVVPLSGGLSIAFRDLRAEISDLLRRELGIILRLRRRLHPSAMIELKVDLRR